MKRLSIFTLLIISLFIVSCNKDNDVYEALPGTVLLDDLKEGTIDFSSEAGSFDLTVTARKNWVIDYSNPQDSKWVTFNPTSGNNKVSKLTISVAANDEFSGRESSLVVNHDGTANTIIVRQKQRDAILAAKREYTIFYEENSLEFTISHNVDFSVETTADWLKHVGTKALQSNIVTFSIEKNTSHEAREAFIIVKGESLEQRIKVNQLPSTHRPVDIEDYEASIEMTHSISKEAYKILGSLPSGDNKKLDAALEKIKEIGNVLDADRNESGTTIMVMQRDSIWVNYHLSPEDSDGFVYDKESDSSFADKIASLAPEKTTARLPRLSVGSNYDKKALILAPFYQDRYHAVRSDIDSYAESLMRAGYRSSNIDIYKGKQVLLKHFTSEFQSEYSVIIIQTHGGIGYQTGYDLSESVNNVSVLCTGIPYTVEVAKSLIDSGVLTDLAVGALENKENNSSDLYIFATPKSFGTHSLYFPLVLMGACESAKIATDNQYGRFTSFMDAYLKHGAEAVGGWKESVFSVVADTIIDKMLKFMSEGFSAIQAEQFWVFSDLADELFSTSRAVVGKESVNQRLFHMRFKYGDFSLYDDVIALDPPDYGYYSRSCTFSWSSVLDDISDLFYYITGKTGDGGYTLSSLYQRFEVHYEVFVDGKRIASTKDKEVTWTPKENGIHKWFVRAVFIKDGLRAATIDSEETQFTFNGPYISVETEEVNMPTEGGQFSIVVDSNIDYEGTISDPDAVKFIKQEYVEGNKKRYYFSLSRNESLIEKIIVLGYRGRKHDVSAEVIVRQEPSLYPEGWTSREFWHRSFLLYYTGTGCAYSPETTTLLNAFKSKQNDKVEIMAVHSKNLSSLAFSGSETIATQFDLSYTPMYLMDGREYSGPFARTVNNLIDMIGETESIHKTKTGIGIRSKLDGNTLTVDVSVLYKQPGSYNVGVYLVEDNVIAYQNGYGEGYRNNWVARKNLSSVLGDKKTIKYYNTAEDYHYTTTISSGSNKSNLRILVFVQENTGNRNIGYFLERPEYYYGSHIDNTASVHIGKTRPVSFVNKQTGGIEDFRFGDDIDFN